MKVGPGAWFVKTGCFVCHSIAALGVKSPAQIGPDLSNAVEDVQSRFGRTIDDFLRLDLRVGRVLDARVFAEARKPAYQLDIDFGAGGVRHSSAQLPGTYPDPAALIGNFDEIEHVPAQVGSPLTTNVVAVSNERAATIVVSAAIATTP